MESKYILNITIYEFTNLKKKFFLELEAEGLFDGSDADLICIQFIYLPLLREKVYQFVERWNSHKIRKQKNRPNLPTGEPFYNYYYPPDNITDFAQLPNAEVIAQLKHTVISYGIYNSYLLILFLINTVYLLINIYY